MPLFWTNDLDIELNLDRDHGFESDLDRWLDCDHDFNLYNDLDCDLANHLYRDHKFDIAMKYLRKSEWRASIVDIYPTPISLIWTHLK